MLYRVYLNGRRIGAADSFVSACRLAKQAKQASTHRASAYVCPIAASVKERTRVAYAA